MNGVPMRVMQGVRRISAIVGAALLLAACGSSSSNSATQTISISRAADVSAQASGYRALMTIDETIGSAGQLVVHGTASFGLATHSGTINMQMTLPAGAAQQSGLGSTLPMKVVLVPGTMYMKFPPQLAQKLPGGKPWWKIDLAQVSKMAGVSGLSSLLSSSNTNEPADYLYMLRAASNGGVQNLGHETINGVPTTHYRAQIDLAKVPNVVPAKERAAMEQLISELRKRGAMPSSTYPMDAWIDSHNLVRQIEMNWTQPISGQSVNMAMKMDFVAYGPQPAPQIPPAGQTVNLVKLLQQRGLG